MTINGTKYVLGDTVVVGMCPDFGQPLFGKVVSFITGVENVKFTCQVYQCDFNSHYHANEVDYITDNTCKVSHSDLLYELPVSMVKSQFSGDFICLRYGVQG